MEKPEGMEKINHKRDWQLFPKHFSISMWLWWKCTWISCAFLAKASGKMQRWRRLISQLTQTAPHEWGRAVWILLPLVNRSFYTTLFLERTLDFPLAQQFGKELDMEGWGGGASFFWRGRGKIVAYFRERLLIRVREVCELSHCKQSECPDQPIVLFLSLKAT